MFYQKCGEEVKEIDNFCGNLAKSKSKKQKTKKEVKTLSLDSYKHFKREERAGHITVNSRKVHHRLLLLVEKLNHSCIM